MFSENFKNLIFAVNLMAGVIIGAGIFALPHVFDQVGFAAAFFYLLIFTAVFVFIHLMYGRIILDTPVKKDLRFAGYAHFYFGKFGYAVAALMTILGGFFVLTIYLTLSVSFLEILGWSWPIAGLLIFWIISSLPIFSRIKYLVWLELISNLMILIIILIVFLFALTQPADFSLFKSLTVNDFFLPFGVMFFSLAGRAAIPQVVKYFHHKDNPALNKSIILGTVIAAFIYLLFVYSVLVLSGSVSEDAISGLMKLPRLVLLSLAVLALVNLWNSYFLFGIDIKESLTLDFPFKEKFAGWLVFFTPLLIYFLGFRNFLPLVGFVGGAFLGLEGIFIILMWQKLVKNYFWKRVSWLLVLIFLSTLVYHVFIFI